MLARTWLPGLALARAWSPSVYNAETNDTTATVAEQGAPVAPDKTTPQKPTSQKKSVPKSRKTGQAAKPSTGTAKEKKPAKSKSAPRKQGKGAKILEMIGRAKGATLSEIMSVCSWQAHSVRGFISTARKKHGVRVESLKNDAGDRVYRAAK
jgi:hypothetical protein